MFGYLLCQASFVRVIRYMQVGASWSSRHCCVKAPGHEQSERRGVIGSEYQVKVYVDMTASLRALKSFSTIRPVVGFRFDGGRKWLIQAQKQTFSAARTASDDLAVLWLSLAEAPEPEVAWEDRA